MAAFGTTPSAGEKRVQKIAPHTQTIGSVYTRIIELNFTTAEAASGAGTVNAYIPAGTHVLAAYINTNATNTNSTTVSLKTTTANKTFVAATAPVKDTWTACTVTNADANLSLNTDDQITVTLGAQAGGFVVCKVQIALICAAVDFAIPGNATYTI